ncbi:hypothetical protein [Piscinibacter sp. XHJ-5]|uniref:hypothetical protein n=1 Tax=Piscinibacter sp. XHJ-5 TaxID=3037797 RepID=UPI0024535DFF|nr:hypothetical protein [Piscinibacter sp. XHJ-5]
MDAMEDRLGLPGPVVSIASPAARAQLEVITGNARWLRRRLPVLPQHHSQSDDAIAHGLRARRQHGENGRPNSGPGHVQLNVELAAGQAAVAISNAGPHRAVILPLRPQPTRRPTPVA